MKNGKELLKKIKGIFFKSKNTPQIEIHSRTDHPGQSQTTTVHRTVTQPQRRITLGTVHTASGENQGQDIGHGIRVKKAGKPKKCPICASPARDVNNNDNIVPDTSGRGSWYCNVCGNVIS